MPDKEGRVGYGIEDLWQDVRGSWADDKNEKQSVARFRAALDALKTALGPTPLPDITEDHLRRCATALRASRGPATVNRHMATLSKALRLQRRHIKHPPVFRDEVWLKVSQPAMVSLTEGQEAAIKTALQDQRGDDYVLLMDVQIASGCRIGELLKVTPGDIVRQVEGNEVWFEMTLRDPKNGRDRIALLPAEMGERWSDLVARGLPHYAAIRRAMRYARKTAGAPMTQPTHAHRHTTATRLTQLGRPTAEVMSYLGHRSIATTLRYIESDTRGKRASLDILTGKA
jgi:integrase